MYLYNIVSMTTIRYTLCYYCDLHNSIFSYIFLLRFVLIKSSYLTDTARIGHILLILYMIAVFVYFTVKLVSCIRNVIYNDNNDIYSTVMWSSTVRFSRSSCSFSHRHRRNLIRRRRFGVLYY